MELTNRDFEILEFLYHQGVATVSQLTEQFFSSHASALVRLGQLKRSGYLVSRPLTDLETVSRSAYRSAQKMDLFTGIGKLHKFRVYCLGEGLRKSHKRSDNLVQPILWKHQIQLNRILRVLTQKFPSAEIIGDPEVRHEGAHYKMGHKEVIPDLVIRDKGVCLAVELERNLKSQPANYSKFVSYKHSAYTRVLYYCENEAIFESISNQSSTFLKIGVALILSPESVYQRSSGFKSLDQFLY